MLAGRTTHRARPPTSPCATDSCRSRVGNPSSSSSTRRGNRRSTCSTQRSSRGSSSSAPVLVRYRLLLVLWVVKLWRNGNACRPLHVCRGRRYAHGDRGAAAGQSSDAGGDAQALHAPQPASRTPVSLRNTLARVIKWLTNHVVAQQVWMSSIRDLRNIGAKFLYPQFCTGGIK